MNNKEMPVYIQDSGHGWLQVKYAELVKLGIQNDISAYSYRAWDYAYLEEDCDMGVYLNALKAQDETCKFKEGRDYRSTYVDGRWVGRERYNGYYVS